MKEQKIKQNKILQNITNRKVERQMASHTSSPSNQDDSTQKEEV